MDPRTNLNVVYHSGNFALVNPEGAMAKVNKYTVMYIVQLDANDMPLMLLYHKNRKTVCTVSLMTPKQTGGNDVISFAKVLAYAVKRMQCKNPCLKLIKTV